jgi:O-succinylbenzoic acid--CoA ligase
MDNLTYKNVHNRFKLNGFHLDKEDLCRVAYSFIKEGEDFEKPVGNFLLDWFDEKDFIEMKTSGSTGNPKLIQVKKQAMVNSAIATGDFFELLPGDKVFNCLPIKFVAGKLMFVRSFILGLDMDFVEPTLKPLKNNETIYEFSAMVPLQAQNSIEELKNVKKLIVGGSKISLKLEKELLKLNTKSFETFGMTETVSHIAAKKVGEKVFTVLPNVSVDIDDRRCLVIQARSVSDEKIVTNDLINLISPTQFEFLGRIDNIINSGGIKFMPEQIEDKLKTHLSRRFFIAGKPDFDLGEKLVLVIEGERFEVDQAIFNQLDKYEKPKEIIFIPKFKETGNGKIIRKDSIK